MKAISSNINIQPISPATLDNAAQTYSLITSPGVSRTDMHFSNSNSVAVLQILILYLTPLHRQR